MSGWLEDLRANTTKAGGGEATDAEVEQFAAEHTRSEQPWHLTEYVVPKVRNANGDGTRNPTRDALCEAARDARVGWCSWAKAKAEIEVAARDSYAERGAQFGKADFERSVKYAVAQASAEDMPKLEARYGKRLAQEQRLWEMVEDWAVQIDEPATGYKVFKVLGPTEWAKPPKQIEFLIAKALCRGTSGPNAGPKKSLKTHDNQAIG